MLFNNISFILHKQQLSENIGSCARAMKNLGVNVETRSEIKILPGLDPA